MKYLTAFALILTTVFGLPNKEIKSRNVVVPAGKPQGRITRGHNAAEAQFPHQVGLLRKKLDGSYSWCGGSLISHNHVLTAAHCTNNAEEVEVLLGSINRDNPKVTYTVLPKDIVIHERYSHLSNKYDISLIKIPYTEYSENIKPIKLATKDLGYVDENAVISGWGDNSDSHDEQPVILQFAKTKIISNNLCAKTFEIIPSHICISTLGAISTCDGDSGGPLVLESSKTLVGVFSFVAQRGCELQLPAVFTRVARFLDWIQHNSK